ncbi:MAG: quinone oxidoreductase [Paenibacillaceae bacterium]|jgi:NADPH2:quinone reductase|nr:quinone oxidoreductase [Paenibacillaceae bacterium]
MKAVMIAANKDLLWSEVPDPVLADGEVLVEIHAAALNRADLMQRAGNYPPPPGCPEWPGLEIAGVIRELSPAARTDGNWRIGDPVCALLGGGGYAEYAAVHHSMLMPVPKGLSMVEAAAVPEAFATAYLNLFMEGGAKSGDTLLMHAGASGLASVIIPMAKAFGLRVITSVRGSETAASIAHLQADVVVDTAGESIVEVLKREEENGHPLNIAIDCLGSEWVGECFPYVAFGCRWIMIATLAGDLSPVNMRTMYMKNIRLIGSTLRSKPPEVKARILSKLVEEVWPRVESGEVRPTIYKTLPITEAEAAHGLLERGESIGKVVLMVRGD